MPDWYSNEPNPQAKEGLFLLGCLLCIIISIGIAVLIIFLCGD